MRKRTIALIIVVIVVILIAAVVIQGYLLYTAAKGVSVTINSVGADNVKLSTATILITLAFANPSRTSLPPVELNYSAFLGGRYLGNGTVPRFTISGNSVTLQTVSFNVTYSSLAVGAVSSLIKGQYNITVIGKAIVHLLAATIPVSVGFTVNQTCHGLTASNCTQTTSLS